MAVGSGSPVNTPRVVQQALLVTLVDPVNNRIEGVIKQGQLINIFMLAFPTFWVWPNVGETWMIARENNNWVLKDRIQNPGNSVPLMNDLPLQTGYANANELVFQDNSRALNTKDVTISDTGIILNDGERVLKTDDLGTTVVIPSQMPVHGSTVLSAGTSVVNYPQITSASLIFLTSQGGGGGTPGALRISARTPGVSFTISSTSSTDASTVAYQIIEP